MKKSILAMILIATCSWSASAKNESKKESASAANTVKDPVVLLQNNDKALKPILVDYRKSPTPELAAQLRQNGASLFDVAEMSKRALPQKQWEALKPEQQKKFAEDFRTIMEYGFLEKMKNEDAFDSSSYQKPKKLADGSLAVSGLVWSKGKSTKVLYKFKDDGKAIRAYDLETEGLSTLKAYKDQFKKKFDKTNLQGVVDMVAKNADKKRNSQGQ